MKRKLEQITIGVALLSTTCALWSPVAAAEQPNVVIYMADDLGWGSTGPYGANPELVKTPNIDRLARQGMTFSQASTTASVCSPTRYAMLTGRYSWRTSLKFGVVNTLDPLLIDPETPTIGSWLQGKGYQTAHFGKWHLGYKEKQFKNLLGELRPGPNDVGFHYHFGVPNNMDDLHKVYVENRGIHGLRSNRISPYGKSFYGKPYFGYDAPQRHEPEVMEDLNRRAVEWVRQNKETPFFLYFAAVAVHHPIMPSARMLGSSPAGVYGDFIHDVDHSVGRLITALEDEELFDNTIFIFTSDNGGDIPQGDKLRPENQAIAAGLSLNGDFRGDKHTIYEGGLRVPLIVSYPPKVKGARRTSAFVTTADLFATVMELVGRTQPEPGTAPDSYSFAPVLSDPDAPSKRPHGVFRDVNGRQAIRFGPWKLIDDSQPKQAEQKLKLELYNLESDPGEAKDVSAEHPEIVRKGKALLNAIRSAG
jgi:arylsulfatase A